MHRKVQIRYAVPFRLNSTLMKVVIYRLPQPNLERLLNSSRPRSGRREINVLVNEGAY